jgi:hypothetical protein
LHRTSRAVATDEDQHREPGVVIVGTGTLVVMIVVAPGR